MKASTLAALLLSTASILFASVPAIADPASPQTDRASRSGGPAPDKSAAPTPSAAKPGTASADDIVVTDGPATIRIKHIELVGSTMSGADVKALFDTKDIRLLEDRLRKLDAASIVVPEITADSVEGTTETHLVQKQVILADVHGGRASNGSAATTSLAVKDAKSASTVTIGATTFKGLDLAQIAHLAAGPRTDDEEALHPIADEVAANAITVAAATGGQRPVSIASVRETGLKGRPLRSLDGADAMAVFDEVAHSYAADLIEADDFGLTGAPTGSPDDLKGLALRHVALQGFGDGRLEKFEMDGLAIEGNDRKPGTLKLGSALVERVASAPKSIPSVDKIELRDFAADLPVEEKGKPAQRIALSVAHAGYEAPGLVIGKLPPKATLSIEHVTFDVPPNNAAAPLLLAMGYKRLDVSSQSVSRYDSAAKTLAIDKLSISGVGMGALDIKLGLARVDEDIVSQDDKVQKAAAANIQLKSLDLNLRNDGLIDKAIGFKAAIDGIGVDQERQNLGQLIDTGLVGFGLQASAKAQTIVAALHKFIADPKTLHIAIASKAGLGADSLQTIDSPQTLLDSVEVEAGADQ